MKDYYALLGIDTSATKKDIKKNYRKLVTKFHPDKNSAADSASKFIAITEAYEVLSDTKTRAHYDLKRWEAKKRKQEIEYDFTIVKAPEESLRTKRRRVQERRGQEYKQTEPRNQKWFSLLKESFIVSARYIIHIIGMMLLLFITYVAIRQLAEAFDISPGVGVGICIFIIALVYYTCRLLQIIITDLRLDIKTFTILFGESHRVTQNSTLIAFWLMVLMMVVLVLVVF